MEFVEGESITNILKLHVLLGGGMGDEGRVSGPNEGNLCAFYYNGIGTRDERRSIPVLGGIISSINMAFAPARGDASRILREARGTSKIRIAGIKRTELYFSDTVEGPRWPESSPPCCLRRVYAVRWIFWACSIPWRR